MLQGTLGTEIAAEVKGSWEQPPSPAWSIPECHGKNQRAPEAQAIPSPEGVV